MQIFLTILQTILPALLVFLTAWLMMRTFIKKEQDAVNGLIIRQQEQKRLELIKETKKTVLPLRLQAYERLTIFCHRLELSNLISRTTATQEMSAKLYKGILIQTIDEEFNHNITQQMYMTDQLWNIILIARKEATAIIEKAYQTIENPNSSAKDFLESLVEYLKEADQLGHLQAMSAIKKEVGVLFE